KPANLAPVETDRPDVDQRLVRERSGIGNFLDLGVRGNGCRDQGAHACAAAYPSAAMSIGREALEAQLGGRDLPALEGVPSERLDDLADAVAAARRRQAAEIAAAGDHALSHIPRLLRLA